MMSTGGNESVRNSNGRYPFTASQWQELEHQALVYKYMISGMPIPPELLFTIKTSLDASTKLLLHHQPSTTHPTIGWNCFQMGFGRKIDPEPGRCRRTDGKKWRCSKEAYPDSKYCERHMHRGRNRSRKPVEVNNNMASAPPPPTAIPMIAKSTNYPSPNSHPLIASSDYYNNGATHLSAYSRPNSVGGLGNVLSSQDHFLLDSSPYRKRYGGMKEEIDALPFFSESSGTMKTSSMGLHDSSWQLEPLAINNSYSKQRTTYSDYHQNGYNNSSYQQQDQSYCDQFGLKLDKKDAPQKVMHHFFDELPPNEKDFSTTQLSISIPSSAHDFFLSHNDK